MSNSINHIILIVSLITSDGAPSGHVYARLMERMNYDQYTQALHLAKIGEFIKEENHYLTLMPHGLALREKIEAMVQDGLANM